jgi:hypothetical protein
MNPTRLIADGRHWKRLFTKKNLAGFGLKMLPPPSRNVWLTKFHEKKKRGHATGAEFLHLSTGKTFTN